MTVVAPPFRFASAGFPIFAYVGRVNRAASGTGARPTSWYRTPAVNVRAGGSGRPPYGVGGPLSQHLVGLASDWQTVNTGALVNRFRSQGLVAVDEMDHVHVQAWPRGLLDRVLGV